MTGAVARRLRVAAYAICLREDRVLLARYVSPDGAQRHWTLPGGGIEHGEDPYQAVIRETVGGSTDLAVWVPVAEVPGRERAVIVDVGLRLAGTGPADGHVPPVKVAGLLRH